jgi:heptosyltransferase-2
MEILTSEQKKLLVIQTAFIGDAVLTLPFLQMLKEENKDFLIDVVTTSKTASLFEAVSTINKVYILDKADKHKSIFSLVKFGKELNNNNYSIIYSPHRSLRSALLTLFTNVRETYGFDNSEFPYVFKNLVEYKYDSHEIERLFAFLDNGNEYNFKSVKAELNYSEEVKTNISDIFNKFDKTKIKVVFAPGTEWFTKQYPVEHFIEVIKKCKAKEYECILIGSDKEKELCEEIIRNIPSNSINLCGKLSIIETIYLLKKIDLLITNDSAPTHFGMIADIPVLTIYCSTISKFGFYPYNERSKYLSYDELDCKPCGIHGHKSCPEKHFNCGKKLLPQKVFDVIEEILDGRIERLQKL